MSGAAHPKGYEGAPGEHDSEHFLETFERSDITGDSFGFHEHATGDQESQHFFDAFDRSGISAQST
jgi:hypothetical protein